MKPVFTPATHLANLKIGHAIIASATEGINQALKTSLETAGKSGIHLTKPVAYNDPDVERPEFTYLSLSGGSLLAVDEGNGEDVEFESLPGDVVLELVEALPPEFRIG